MHRKRPTKNYPSYIIDFCAQHYKERHHTSSTIIRMCKKQWPDIRVHPSDVWYMAEQRGAVKRTQKECQAIARKESNERYAKYKNFMMIGMLK